LELNGCRIEAYPSNHIDSFRSLTNPKFIFLDEAGMFRKSEQDDVRHLSERYIGKSNPYIVMVSTPNAPHLHMLINKEYLSIPQQHDKLIISLRTAYAKGYSLDKEQTSYSDSLDALRLACKMYKMK
jgi:hypothetical protein